MAGTTVVVWVAILVIVFNMVVVTSVIEVVYKVIEVRSDMLQAQWEI